MYGVLGVVKIKSSLSFMQSWEEEIYIHSIEFYDDREKVPGRTNTAKKRNKNLIHISE